MIRSHIARTPNRKPRISRILFYITHLLFFLIFSVAYAGEYHNSAWKGAPADNLTCSQCHTMHGTQGGISMIYGGASIQPKLLRASSILELCKYCHGTSNPGVVDLTGRIPPPVYNAYNQKSYVPSAGDFADSNVDTNEANRHSVGTDVSAMQPPGYTGNWTDVINRFSTTFNCIYCHDQHGNKNYRNLRYDPGTPSNDTTALGINVTYVMGANSATVDVNNFTTGGLGNNLDKYARNNVTFKRKTAGTPNAISIWCGKCHTKFYGTSAPYADPPSEPTTSYLGGTLNSGALGSGDSTGVNPWYRHPVGDINIGANSNLHTDSTNWTFGATLTVGNPGSTNRVRWADADAPLAFDVNNDEPFCLSCHYAHGGGNATATGNMAVNHSNLVMIDGAGKLNIGDITYIPPDNTTNANAARMRNVCQQCHNQ